MNGPDSPATSDCGRWTLRYILSLPVVLKSGRYIPGKVPLGPAEFNATSFLACVHSQNHAEGIQHESDPRAAGGR